MYGNGENVRPFDLRVRVIGDTITVQVVGGISTTNGPPLSGAPRAIASADIPSASTFGLFVFAAAVVALGVKLLRGTAAAI